MAQWATPPAPILYRGSTASGACPVVIGMHASGGSPTSFDATARWRAAAEAGGYAVVLPSSQTLDSSGAASWAGSGREVTNLAYLKANIAGWVSTVGGDATKVYLTGFSAGAFMALYAAWEGSMVMKGIAPVSGWVHTGVNFAPTWLPYNRSAAMSMLYMMGTKDFAPVAGNVDYQGQRTSALSVVAGNGHSGSATTVTTVAPVTTETWTATNVITKVITGGTHQYPGAPQATGVDTQVDATAIIADWMLTDSGGSGGGGGTLTSYVKDLKTGGNTSGTGSTTLATTLNATAAATNTVIVIVGNNSNQTVAGIADTAGNTYTKAVAVTQTVNPAENVEIWYTNQDVAPCANGAVITATFSASNSRKFMFVMEYKGNLVAGVTATGSSAAATTLDSGTTATTTSSGGTAIAAFMLGTSQGSWTKDTNYLVPAGNLVNLTDRTLVCEYQDMGTPATQHAAGTISSTTFAGCIATFHPPALPIGAALPARLPDSTGAVTNVNSVATFNTAHGGGTANGGSINFTASVDGASATTTISRAAAAGAPITITRDPGVLLTNWSWKITGSYLKLIDIHISGGSSDGIRVTDNAHDIDLDRVHSHGNAGAGIAVVSGASFAPSNIQIYNCEVHNNTANGINFGVNIGTGVIANVLAYNNTGQNVLCYPDVSGLIVTAVTADGGTGGIEVGSEEGTTDNVIVVGCIGTNSTSYAITPYDPPAGDTGNLAFDCLGFGNTTGDFLADASFVYDHCTHLDPQYVNRSGQDYHPRAGSPVQNYVTVDQQKYLPVTDRDGELRVTPDAGCYIADTTVPPQPGNLTPPVLTGNPVVGSVLTVSDGTWTPTPGFISYAWKLETGNSTGVYQYVDRAITNHYTPLVGDVGRRIVAEVTAGIQLVSNPSFDGSFETGDWHPWQPPQASNYGYVDTAVAHFGPWNIETTIVGQGNYSGKFSVPASPSLKQRCQLIQPRNVDVGTDDYYSFMWWVPLDWAGPGVAPTVFAEFAELNFQNIGPGSSNIALALRADHVTLVMRTGQLNATGPVYPWNSDADASPNQSGVDLYAIPPGSLTLGVWHQLVLHFFWATDSTGVAEVWHREKGPNAWTQTVNLTGHPTLQLNTDGTLPTATHDSIRLYRGPATTSLDVYLDGFARHASLASAQAFLPPSGLVALSNVIGPVTADGSTPQSTATADLATYTTSPALASYDDPEPTL